MSSSKRSRDGGKKPSVFERLGSKPSSSSVTEDYCKQWAHKGTCSYGSKCKFLSTHNSKNKNSSSGRDSRKRSRSRSLPRKEISSKHKSSSTGVSKGGKSHDPDSGEWEKSLEQEDELALERKLQMLQRELAKEEQEHKGKGKKVPAKKRERSSSSSSTSSSSSSDSSSDSSDSSSSSSGSSSSTSSSSSDSDGEVKDKKPAKKKNQDRGTKRSHSSLSANPANKSKIKPRPKKSAKVSPHAEGVRKKESISTKKQSRGSQSLITPPRRHHVSSSSGKHIRESPSYSPAVRGRSSPRLKESDALRERRARRSPEGNEAKRKLAPPPRRRDEHSPPGRARDRKATGAYESRVKTEKPRDRLLEPNYMIRPRSPSYRDPYPVRDCSPTAFRDRSRADPYDTRRPYSPPPPKLERKDDPYDLPRSRRPASPEPLRRLPARSKEYHDYERDWPGSDTAKIADWDHPDYRRSRNRPIDDGNWSRNSDTSWKKAYTPPPPPPLPASTSHAYSEVHSSRSGNWDPVPQPPPSSSRRNRERRSGSHRTRESRRNTDQPAKIVDPAPPEGSRSPTANPDPPKSVTAHSDGEAEDLRPSSAAVEVDESVEDFSDFSDDVDEILNRDPPEPKGDPIEEGAESDAEVQSAPADVEVRVETSSAQSVCSPKPFSPIPSVVDGRADEDLLGGMEIEQVSDEELEEEAKSAPVDALDVDWASLACKRDKKPETGEISARQRWERKEVLARLGIAIEGQKTAERKPLFVMNALFRRALSARMDLTFRRTLCGLPARELLMEHCDDDMTLYKASVDLLLRDQAVAS